MQINTKFNVGSGLAQPCHCEFHDPKQCQEEQAEDELEREELALSIKNALMLNDRQTS